MLTLDKAARRRIITGLAAVLGTALMAFEAMPVQAAPPPHAPANGYRRKQQQQQQNRNNNRRHTPTRNDIDGDGIPNSRDRDVDGDGIPNSRDRDIDGDGVQNDRDRDDYNSSRRSRDTRGNWYTRNAGKTKVHYGQTPAGYYRDRNGKLVRRQTPVRRSVNTRTRRVGDRDNDGTHRDRDMDDDGIRNRRDRDKDGDGTRNKRDDFDKNPSRR